MDYRQYVADSNYSMEVVVIKTKNYKRIPEGADYKTVLEYLLDFIQHKDEIVKNKGAFYALEQLGYIAEQYCYYELSEKNSDILYHFLISVIDFDNYELMDLMLFIVVNFSLRKVFDWIKEYENSFTFDITDMLKEIEPDFK